MSQVLVTEQYLDDIADAIRSKNGSENTYTPAQMAGAIENIGGGGNGNTVIDEAEIKNKSGGSFTFSKSATIQKSGQYKITAVSYANNLSITVNGVSQPINIEVSNDYVRGYSQTLALSAGDIVKVSSSGTGKCIATVSIVDLDGVELVPKTITQNGTYNASDDNADGYSQVMVNVSGGSGSDSVELVPKTITQNGTYNASDDNADGYSSITVNVSGGGGSYPVADAFINGKLSSIVNLGNYAYGSYLHVDSQYVRNFLAHARSMFGSTKGTSSNYGEIAQKVAVTQSDLQGTLQAFGAKFPALSSAEYDNYVYGQTQILSEIGAVLLGDFSQGGEAAGNALSDSIDNYSAVLLQGIYQKNRTSQFNISMLYVLPELNTAYWTGMKDRNNSYDCNVTFTDDSTVSLTGNNQVIIYGIP